LTISLSAHESTFLSGFSSSCTNTPFGLRLTQLYSLYNGARSVQLLARAQKGISLAPAPPSNQQQKPAVGTSRNPQTPHHQHIAPRERATEPAKITERMRENAVNSFRPAEDDEEPGRSTAEIIAVVDRQARINNKENQPVDEEGRVIVPKRRFVDHQPNAQKVSWSQDESNQDSDPPSAHHLEDEQPATINEEEDSEDTGFQSDDRIIAKPRRQEAHSFGHRASHVARQSPPKRVRSVSDDTETRRAESKRRRREQQAQENELQASAREAGADDEDDPAASSYYREVNQLAKVMRAQSAPYVRQSRVPWSQEEETRLLELIADIGCSWSTILTEGRAVWNPKRGQVSLKDKARNMKVDYLLARAELPTNFDRVALSKKEMDRVKKAGLNPYRREGEIVGEEAYNMDGKYVQA